MTPLEITLLILLATILAFVSGKIPFAVISSGMTVSGMVRLSESNCHVQVTGSISNFILRSRMSRPEAYSVALFSMRSFFSRT